MRWIVRCFCSALLGGLLCLPVAHGAPTSRPVAAAPSQAKPGLKGQVFVGLKRLRRLLRTRRGRSFEGIVPLQARYRGHLKKGWLLLEAQLTLYQHNPKRSRSYALGGRGGVLFDLKLQGKDHAPRRDHRGLYWLTLKPGKGPVEVRYRYGLKVPSARGEHQLALSLPRCAHATLDLYFPGKGWEARTLPASAVRTKEEPKGTHASLRLPGTSTLTLIWKGKRIDRKEKTRFRAQIETLLTLQEGLLQGHSTLHVEVLTGALRSLRFALPAQVEVLHVGGQGVVEWFAKKKGALRVYTAQLSRAIRKSVRIAVRFEKSHKGKRVELPQLQLRGAEQSSGMVGVLAKADTEVSHASSSHALQVDVRSLPARIRRRSSRPILLAYRSNHRQPKIVVQMVRHPRLKVLNTVINRAHFETVRTRAGREVVKAKYYVTNNRRQFMPIRLPKGAQIVGAFVAGLPVQPALANGKTRRSLLDTDYLLPLIRSSKRRTSQVFTVELLYTQKAQKLDTWGVFRAKLPATTLQILSYRWDYYLPSSHRDIWLAGSAQNAWQVRLLRRLDRRLLEDLRAGTPALWAGRRKARLNIYNKLGLKERFSPTKSLDVSSSQKGYRSRFAKAQFQVRAQMPLVGRKLTFRGHLVHTRAPYVKIWYLQSSVSTLWFWGVLFSTAAMGLLFLLGLFGPGGVRWSWLLLAVMVWGFLFCAGFFLPLTYLAGLRGLLFAFWGAVLLGLASERSRFAGSGYLRFARWASVGLTFAILLDGSLQLQIASLFLAVPIYPALLPKRSKDQTPEEPPPPEAPPEPPEPEDSGPEPDAEEAQQEDEERPAKDEEPAKERGGAS